MREFLQPQFICIFKCLWLRLTHNLNWTENLEEMLKCECALFSVYIRGGTQLWSYWFPIADVNPPCSLNMKCFNKDIWALPLNVIITLANIENVQVVTPIIQVPESWFNELCYFSTDLNDDIKIIQNKKGNKMLRFPLTLDLCLP